MIKLVTMPKLSDTMKEGTIIKWHKKKMENILKGDLLVEIETDKAIQEFESEIDGYLIYIGLPEGKSAKVDSIIAIIGDDPNLNISNILREYSNKEKVIMTFSKRKRIFVSPLALELSRKKNISLEKIKGSGTNGRIIKRDIENHEMEISQNNNINYSILASNEVIHSSIRRVIAKRLTNSKINAPHYYLIVEIDMKNAIQSRIVLNNNLKEKEQISINDLIIKAAALSLKDNPKINSSWNENKIIYHKNINIGIAIAVIDGLLVPVITQADNKSIKQISLEVKKKTTKVRARKISQEEMNGSTFTISNLGMFGIESFTSIINQPNSSILSIGTILDKPVIANGVITPGNIMKLSLSCDHRVIDGAVGSIFLQSIKKYLESPILMIL